MDPPLWIVSFAERRKKGIWQLAKGTKYCWNRDKIWLKSSCKILHLHWRRTGEVAVCCLLIGQLICEWNGAIIHVRWWFMYGAWFDGMSHMLWGQLEALGDMSWGHLTSITILTHLFGSWVLERSWAKFGLNVIRVAGNKRRREGGREEGGRKGVG